MRAWVMPASYTAQRSTGGPCRDSRPGGPLRSEECTVMSSPVNRAALAEEENRSLPPSQQVSARPVRGPTPYRRSASTFAPVRCRAASASWWRSGPSWASVVASVSRAVAGLLLPGRRQVDGRGGPQRLQARLGAQRSLAQRRGALVEEHRVDPLHRGSVLAAQVVVGLQQRPVLQDVRRRDLAVGQPALGQP